MLTTATQLSVQLKIHLPDLPQPTFPLTFPAVVGGISTGTEPGHPNLSFKIPTFLPV